MINDSGTKDVIYNILSEMFGTEQENIRLEERVETPQVLYIFLPQKQEQLTDSLQKAIKEFLPQGVVAILYIQIGWDNAIWDKDLWDNKYLVDIDFPILHWNTIGIWSSAVWAQQLVIQ